MQRDFNLHSGDREGAPESPLGICSYSIPIPCPQKDTGSPERTTFAVLARFGKKTNGYVVIVMILIRLSINRQYLQITG